MRAVIQRVSSSQVVADGVLTGRIGKGLTILFGVKKGDSERDAELLALKISKLRIFSDENDKMNLSVKDVCGSALVVSNFTLYANYAHGNRPDYFTKRRSGQMNFMNTSFHVLKKRYRMCNAVFSAHICSLISEMTDL